MHADLDAQRPTGPLPLRAGALTVGELIDLYMAHYAGRDPSRPQRLNWWRGKVGELRLDEVSDDHLHVAMESLAERAARYYAGKDADERPIFRAKRKPMSPATMNRYINAMAAVFTWAIRRRIAPKGWDHPARRIERKAENNEKTRFLAAGERDALLHACRAAAWPRLYLLVLMALTTGARKGELLGLRWCDLDLQTRLAHVGRSKNGDPKSLPLVPAVLDELERFKPEKTDSTGLVFPSPRRARQPCAFEEGWKEAMRAARIKDFRFHDLRHTCASMLAQNGATLLEIGDLLGHRQVSMTKRYSHLAASHRSALVNRVLGEIR